MTNKIYIVTDGEYSDFRILSVFSTRQKAEKYAEWVETCTDSYNGSVDIKVLPLDVYLTEIDQGLSPWSVWLPKDSTEESIDVWKLDPTDVRMIGLTQFFNKYLSFNKTVAGYRAYVFAKDEKSAIKIASEKIRAFKLEQSQKIVSYPP